MEILKINRLIVDLAIKDFKARFSGSYLGIVWAFIQPTITLLIFWFVFQVGFKSVPVDNFPFILWLAAAFIPWNFFADSVQTATHSITDNSYLVKKIVFRTSVLPIVRIFSSFMVHLYFIAFLIVIFSFYGYFPNLYYLQIIYYEFCLIVLIVGISWVTSSLIIFLKDVGQLVTMLLQFGFWLTPIFYSIQIVPEKYHFWVKLNPLYYITNGFRDILINKIWFWEKPNLTLYYWIVTCLFLIVGAFMYKKLKPHFADVL